jgi:hypothetical protein
VCDGLLERTGGVALGSSIGSDGPSVPNRTARPAFNPSRTNRLTPASSLVFSLHESPDPQNHGKARRHGLVSNLLIGAGVSMVSLACPGFSHTHNPCDLSTRPDARDDRHTASSTPKSAGRKSIHLRIVNSRAQRSSPHRDIANSTPKKGLRVLSGYDRCRT